LVVIERDSGKFKGKRGQSLFHWFFFWDEKRFWEKGSVPFFSTCPMRGNLSRGVSAVKESDIDQEYRFVSDESTLSMLSMVSSVPLH